MAMHANGAVRQLLLNSLNCLSHLDGMQLFLNFSSDAMDEIVIEVGFQVLHVFNLRCWNRACSIAGTMFCPLLILFCDV